MLAVVATDLKNGIGKNNQLLCHLPDDLKYFKKITTNNIVVMGRKTFESIGKPLPNRINIVLTHQSNLKIDGVNIVNSVDEIINDWSKKFPDKQIIIIGGQQIYQLFLPHITEIHRTLIHHTFDADAFFPAFENDFELIEKQIHPQDEKHPYSFEFQVWKRKSKVG
jgi:dihydrofolate reductase